MEERRSSSPVLSCASTRSDQSKENEQCSVEQGRSSSPVPSCVSMRSDQSKGEPPLLESEQCSSMVQNRSSSPVPSCVSMKSDQSKGEPPLLKAGHHIREQSPVKMKRSSSPVPSAMRSDQSKGEPPLLESEQWSPDHLQSSEADKTAVAVYTLGQVPEASVEGEIRQSLMADLIVKHQFTHEGVAQQGDLKPLSVVYTEVYITEGEHGDMNTEHEVRQIERKSWRDEALDRPIKCNDLFKPAETSSESGKTVLTKGVAGIGKTISVQKFILDWAEGKANQHVRLLLPIPFRELNLLFGQTLSLLDLIHTFFPKTASILDKNHLCKCAHQILFVFDGLDECRCPLDFQNNPICQDPTQPTSVEVLLTNLLKRNLLPDASLWITSRPAASSQIPPECVDQLTEVRGFYGSQREEYFRKRIRDEHLADRVISHLRSSRSLYIMCHIPVLCWLTATVLEKTLLEMEEGCDAPRTLTQMYTRFLTIHIDITKKYTRSLDGDLIFRLARLAYEQLEKGNLLFYEAELKECGIDVDEASVFSGLCTQIFKEECCLSREKVYCFVHLTIQEYLAALYLMLCFKADREIPPKYQQSRFPALFQPQTLHDLHKAAVDLAAQNKNGQLDLLLRFLLGLSLGSNQAFLRSHFPQTRLEPERPCQTVEYVKQKIRENPLALQVNSKFTKGSSARMVNLFYSLNEMNQHAVVEVIDKDSRTVSVVMLLPGEWNTRKFVFKATPKVLDDFDLQKYIKTPEKDLTESLSPNQVLQRLLPILTESFAADLENCKLSAESSSTFAAALCSEDTVLQELNLNSNDLTDSGIKGLCKGIGHPNCKLKKLELIGCKLSAESCCSLVTALTCRCSSLQVLRLNGNDLYDAGIKQLSTALSHPNCRLLELWLCNSKLTKDSCASLASALGSGSSSLVKLNVRYNKLKASDVEQLIAQEKNPNCSLKTLQWRY